jgi:hypothetical protein
MAIRSFLIAGLLLTAPVAAFAQTPPSRHLSLVEGLRSRGMADLALEYLQKLSENPPEELRGRIALEIAKTRVILAEQEDDERLREAQITAAQAAFETFLSSSPDPLSAADAHLEIAKLLSRRGRELSANRRSDESANDDGASARLAFDGATRQVRAAIGRLQTAPAVSAEIKASIAHRLVEATLEEEVIRLQHAMTYSEEKSERRAAAIERASKGFEQIAEKNAGHAVGWLARVLAARCWMELDSNVEARRAMDAIANDSIPAETEAGRQFRFYQLQWMSQEVSSRHRLPEIIRGCEEWLKKFAPFARTPEGQGVTLLLAKSLATQAKSGITDGKNGAASVIAPSSRAQLQRAQRLLKSIAESNGEYAQRARQVRGEILILLTAERVANGIDRLESFEDGYLTAQVEAHFAMTARGETERMVHLRRSIAAMQRGLSLANRSVPAKEVVDAQVMLAYLFLAAGDSFSAAVMGEYVGRTHLQTSRGAQAAAYAVTAWARITGNSRAGSAPPEEVASDEKHLRDLAAFMQATWPDDPATDAAKFQLGLLEYDARHFIPAFRLFIGIRPTFPGYADALYRASLAVRAASDKECAEAATTKLAMRAQVIEGLRKLRMAGPGSVADHAVAVFQAKLELGNLLLSGDPSPAMFDEVTALATTLQSALPTLLGEKHPSRAQIDAEIERLATIALIRQASLLAKTEKYEQALALLQPAIKALNQAMKDQKPLSESAKSWQTVQQSVRRELALAALRAAVNADRAEQVKVALECMQRLTPGDNLDTVHQSLLRVVIDLKQDLDVAKMRHDTAREQRIQTGLTNLLSQLNKPREMTIEERVFLAQAYSAIDRHQRAAELLAAVPAPKEDDIERVNNYRFARLGLAREYRLGKDFTQAKRTLREILGTQAKPGWGQDNFDVRKEMVLVMKDEGNHAGAARMAVEMQNRLLPMAQEYDRKAARVKVLRADSALTAVQELNQIEQEVQRLRPLRERFFEFYLLELKCIADGAVKLNEVKSKAALERLAVRIAKIEQINSDLGSDAVREQFREFIEANSVVKGKYLADGGKLLSDNNKKVR